MAVQAHPRSEIALCNFSLVVESLQFQHNLGPVLHRLKNSAGFLLKTSSNRYNSTPDFRLSRTSWIRWPILGWGVP